MIPFSPPHINQEIIDEVVHTLKSGWITTGPKTKKFENKLSTYCNVEQVLCVNSATFGLELILRWFGVGEGDEVIIPAYTYAATANVVIHTGATPVMIDVNKDDFNISINGIKEKITSKTKVIIPVDIAGLPCNYTEIMEIANSNTKFKPKNEVQHKLGRILVLSDAAHSFGAKYLSKKSGSLCDISVFSFHAVKNLTTAEGGAICINMPKPFNNLDIYTFLNMYSLHGQNKDALAKTKIGNWRYDVKIAGYKGNMTDIQASMGLIGLKYYDSKNLKRRNEIFNTYFAAFSKKKWAINPTFKTEEKQSSYHLYLLRIKNISEKTRDKIIEEIFINGVSVNVHFQPLPLLTAYKNIGYKINDYPISFDNYSKVISLPVYQDLSNDDLKIIVKTVINSVEKFI
jgi:dTDP-4-amino-4,6-dideoxygalactose transaminase